MFSDISASMAAIAVASITLIKFSFSRLTLLAARRRCGDFKSRPQGHRTRFRFCEIDCFTALVESRGFASRHSAHLLARHHRLFCAFSETAGCTPFIVIFPRKNSSECPSSSKLPDECIVSHISHHFRKAANVVALTMGDMGDQFPQASRRRRPVRGRLHLDRMRSSKVRLPGAPPTT